MSEQDWLNKYEEKYKDDPEYIAEGIFLETVEQILAVMDYHNISKSELAERMGVSRAYISKLFNNSTNLTLETLAKIGLALGVPIGITVGTGAPRLHKITAETTRMHYHAKRGQQPDFSKLTKQHPEQDDESQTGAAAA